MLVFVCVSGSTVYTCMLNKRGGAEADLTVSRLEPGTANLPLAPQSNGEEQRERVCVCVYVCVVFIIICSTVYISCPLTVILLFIFPSPLCFISCRMDLSFCCIFFWISRFSSNVLSIQYVAALCHFNSKYPCHDFWFENNLFALLYLTASLVVFAILVVLSTFKSLSSSTSVIFHNFQ